MEKQVSVAGRSEKGKSVLKLLIGKRAWVGHTADVPGNGKHHNDQKRQYYQHDQGKWFAV